MGALTRLIDNRRANKGMTTEIALRMKGNAASGGLLMGLASPNIPSIASDWQQQSKNRESYAFFRSTVYAAVNALALKASQQSVNVGKLEKNDEEKAFSSRKEFRAHERQRKMFDMRMKGNYYKMTATLRNKATPMENIEIFQDHPVLRSMERPNPLQHRFQFVYSFVANICLTGTAYIVRDRAEDGTMHYYSLPSTWVRPDHQHGPYSRYFITNPRNLDYVGQGEPVDASNVARMAMPNPADIMGAMSPSNSQSAAIRVDDRIQTCKERFFDNGIFPSVLVTIGKDPHPDVPGGLRPRLTGAQRRQVAGAIRRTMGSVANFGNPAIVDGLIESITPFSRDANQLGWPTAEPEIKTRILSAFGVHPFLLGENCDVGGYAQTYNILTVFYERVNAYLDMLSMLMTWLTTEPSKSNKSIATRLSEKDVVSRDLAIKEGRWVPQNEEEDIEDGEFDTNGLVVWWEEAQATDPSMYWSNINEGRNKGDITENEWRTAMKLPPNENSIDPTIPANAALSLPNVMTGIGTGLLQPDQAQAFMEGLGVPIPLAKRMCAGQPMNQGMQGGGFPQPSDEPDYNWDEDTDDTSQDNPDDEESDTSYDDEESAKRAILLAVKALREPITVAAEVVSTSILEDLSYV